MSSNLALTLFDKELKPRIKSPPAVFVVAAAGAAVKLVIRITSRSLQARQVNATLWLMQAHARTS